MKINDDHMYHGAALTQLAEHPRFTAINAFEVDGKRSRSAFRINDDVGVYVKYATAPASSYNEYVFNFRQKHLIELDQLKRATKKVFVVLVCIKDKEICCMSRAELEAIIESRQPYPEIFRNAQYAVLVRLEKGKRFWAYTTPEGKKKQITGKRLVPRNRFPGIVFA